MAGHGSVRVILGSLAANMGIAAAKGVAAAVTGSGSMMAESIHSLADCTNQILLLVGAKEAEKPATPEHPLGQGRAAYFWSFLVALMIFLGGGVFSMYEGWHKLHEPSEVGSPWVAYVVLGVAIAIEAAAALQCFKAIDGNRGAVPFWQYLGRTKDIDLVVLFAENTAAVMGLLLALGFLGVADVTGDPVWDAYGTLSIGILLCGVAVWLAREVKSLLQGEAAEPEIEALFYAMAEATPGVDEVLNLITLQQGPGQVMLAAKVRIDPALSAREAAEAINALEESVRNEHPHVKWQFVEPDIEA
ncbi:MAG: cation diffusion facilitator family transporter [Alphaproteobacteria bacterium]|nr:cation diffusion facilitator family transporter [Alphaproteobacteria bacterium]